MNIETLRDVYDDIYSSVGRYNRPDYLKFSLDFAKKIDGTILDAGSGKGHHARQLIRHGIDVFAIELSPICCERFLSDVPHECTDIISHAESERAYDGVICFGVMEHIPYEDIDETLAAISNLSKNALFAIANHSDIIRGHQLHLIQEDMNWWSDKLIKYYSKCILVQEFRRLFVLECSRDDL